MRFSILKGHPHFCRKHFLNALPINFRQPFGLLDVQESYIGRMRALCLRGYAFISFRMKHLKFPF